MQGFDRAITLEVANANRVFGTRTDLLAAPGMFTAMSLTNPQVQSVKPNRIADDLLLLQNLPSSALPLRPLRLGGEIALSTLQPTYFQ
jgi:hypothetical protein